MSRPEKIKRILSPFRYTISVFQQVSKTADCRPQYPLVCISLFDNFLRDKMAVQSDPGRAGIHSPPSPLLRHYLIEAECQYMMGNESAAQKLLEELNVSSGRDPEYTCTKTGEELLAEIKTYRGIELWGEGFDFGDLKRWNDPINRKGFKEGGSSYMKFAITCEQNEATNWWTSVVPQNEANYNPEIK